MAKTVNHGHAVYFEFHDTEGQGYVSQFVIVGFTAVPNKVVPMTGFYRTITPQNPQLPWRPDAIETIDPEVTVNVVGTLTRMARPETAMRVANEAYKQIASTVDAMGPFNWAPYKKPFVIQVSELDIADIHSKVSPKKLFDRVRRVRTALGWADLPTAAGRKAAAK